MNDAQQIFTVFYAIFWGAVFSVSGRWKAFNFGAIFDNEVKYVTKRIIVAKLILNIFPILYFVLILFELRSNELCPQQMKISVEFAAIVLSGVIPAFAIFGFYRLWIGVIEYSPKLFYDYGYKLPTRYKPYYATKNIPEPGLEDLGILPSCYYSYRKNIFFGFAYITLAGAGVKLPYSIILGISLLCFIHYVPYINLSILCRPRVNEHSIETTAMLYLLFVLTIFIILSYLCYDYHCDPMYGLIKKYIYNLNTANQYSGPLPYHR